jgi:ribosomal protein L18
VLHEREHSRPVHRRQRAGKTLAAASTVSKSAEAKELSANVAGAETIGKIGRRRRRSDKGIEAVVFDRGSATVSTARSRRWRMPRVKPGLNF